MSIYDDLKPLAASVLKEFDQGGIQLVNIAVSGPADAPVNTETIVPLNGTSRGVTFQHIDGKFVVASDLMVTVAVVDGVTPTENDFIIIDGVRHKIIKDISVPAAGTRVAWKFVVRKGG